MKDFRIEQLLNDLHISWEYEPNVLRSNIDVKKSKENNARGIPYNQPTITLYTRRMKAGDKFPALIGHKEADKKIRILDGNQRNESYGKAQIPTCDFYFVKTDNEEILDLITKRANAEIETNYPLTQEERISHAMTEYLTGKISYETAASAHGIGESTLREEVVSNNIKERLQRHGFGTAKAERLGKGRRIILARIKQDNALIELAQLTLDAHLSPNELPRIADEVVEKQTDPPQQLVIISNYRQNLQSRISRPRKNKTLNLQDKMEILFIQIRNFCSHPELLKPYTLSFKKGLRDTIRKLEEVEKYGDIKQ